jgi:ATP-binding cassette subfamily F protein 2
MVENKKVADEEEVEIDDVDDEPETTTTAATATKKKLVKGGKGSKKANKKTAVTKAPASSAPKAEPAAGVAGGAGGGDLAVGSDVRVATGLLASMPRSKDLKIIAFSLSVHGKMMVEDTVIELQWGHRYGLVGRNGCGKSSFLRCLANREVPIPDHIDTYLLSSEAKACDMTGLEYVIDSAKKEIVRLDALIEDVLEKEGPESELLQELYESQEALDEATFETRASTILIGLGFNKKTIHKKCCDMSGGWRMRVALARALFICPSMLLLDEPTNHLDLEACVWLEEYLANYKKILVVVSHSQDFLNGVCTNTIVMQQKKIKYWGGNYDMYIKTREEHDKNQATLYKKQQVDIAATKEFIASCGTYSNLVKQAKSRQKMLDKMVEDGLIEPPFQDPMFRFKFPDSGALTTPLVSFVDVAFSYSGKKDDYLFSKLSFGIGSDSRVCLVGPNGAGKSTLLKLMVQQINPCEGNVSLRSGMSIGRYHQHSAEVLDEDLSPVEYLQSKYKDRYPTYRLEEWRGIVGTYGIPSENHLTPIRFLSEGLKTRLVFCEISLNRPHLLLLDEPTNASDMEMIDSLADAIKLFKGGVIVISHDFRLLSQIAEEIWVVDRGLKIWDGDIRSYKAHLKKTNIARMK